MLSVLNFLYCSRRRKKEKFTMEKKFQRVDVLWEIFYCHFSDASTVAEHNEQLKRYFPTFCEIFYMLKKILNIEFYNRTESNFCSMEKEFFIYFRALKWQRWRWRGRKENFLFIKLNCWANCVENICSQHKSYLLLIFSFTHRRW